MTWVKLDEAFWSHQKIRAAGTEATGLFVCGLAWCNQNLSDGSIPRYVLGMLTDLRRPEKTAERLVEVGLWHETEAGWDVHDYLDYQPSKSQVESQRASQRDRQKKSRSKKAVSHDTPTRPDPDPSRTDAVLLPDDDSPPPADRSSSWDQHPHWKAISEAGLILARSKVPQPRNLDAFATTCARNIAQEQGWAIAELLTLRPDLEDPQRLAAVLANGGAPKAIADTKAMSELGSIEDAPDFIDAADLKVVGE